ncbi:MAG: phenylacetate-CoA oxygenase subunit PaaC [Gemmatimonadaceae bacterium]|nr:phenylacetate-CoA oxygenase subunit PaaC [Gemmatimonadaceae bacterium]
MSVPEFLLRLSDDRLILGHRLSEWCGHGPILEEDIALANISLDLIGQANLLLELAGKEEGRGRTGDQLAYFREAVEFRNALIMELPRGDFGFTIARQFLVSVFGILHLERLSQSRHGDLAGIAAKALKETRYHARHSADWILKLGDGTAESHRRVQDAIDELWRYTGELFEMDDLERALAGDGLAADRAELREPWRAEVGRVLAAASLKMPADGFMQRGGREGRHTEHLGHLLAEMQIVARSFPGAEW